MSDFDPFATAPADEAQNEPTPEPQAQSQDPWQTVADEKVAPVTADSEKVRITFKSGSGYDVPWVTTDFPSIDVAHDRLSDLDRQKKLVEIFDITGKAANAFWAKLGGSNGAAKGGNTNQRQNAPQGATQPPAWFPPAPAEGWVYKTGFKKDGSGAWHAWAPARKGEGDWQFHNPPK